MTEDLIISILENVTVYRPTFPSEVHKEPIVCLTSSQVIARAQDDKGGLWALVWVKEEVIAGNYQTTWKKLVLGWISDIWHD